MIARPEYRKILQETASLDFPSINAAASSDLTISLPGAAIGDPVILGRPAAPQAGLIYQSFVSAAGVVTVRATNITGGAVNAAAQSFTVQVPKIF